MLNILLTGKPSVGKSTVIQKVIELLGKDKVAGFWTMELRASGKRVGFSIQTIDGVACALAHINNKDGPRVGKYRVFVKHIEEVAIPALVRARNSSKIIIIDEIASMELKSLKFAPEVRRCLDTGRVLGTLQRKSAPFQDEVRARKDSIVLDVTLKNRDSIPAQVVALIIGSNGF